MGGLTALQELHLGDNQLTGGLEALQGCPALQTLYLEGNQLTTLPESIGQLSTLEGLDLEGNHLRSRGLMAVADALKTNTALQQLRFCNNGVGAVRPPRVARCTNTLLTRTAWTPSSLSRATGRRSGSEQGHDGGAG